MPPERVRQIVLAQPTKCAKCNRRLPAGLEAELRGGRIYGLYCHLAPPKPPNPPPALTRGTHRVQTRPAKGQHTSAPVELPYASLPSAPGNRVAQYFSFDWSPADVYLVRAAYLLEPLPGNRLGADALKRLETNLTDLRRLFQAAYEADAPRSHEAVVLLWDKHRNILRKVLPPGRVLLHPERP